MGLDLALDASGRRVAPIDSSKGATKNPGPRAGFTFFVLPRGMRLEGALPWVGACILARLRPPADAFGIVLEGLRDLRRGDVRGACRFYSLIVTA